MTGSRSGCGDTLEPGSAAPAHRPLLIAAIIDSAILGDIFNTPAMRDVWSDENRTAKYLTIESALAKVQSALGLIPSEAAAEI